MSDERTDDGYTTCDCCGIRVLTCDTEEVDLVDVCMDCLHAYDEYEDYR